MTDTRLPTPGFSPTDGIRTTTETQPLTSSEASSVKFPVAIRGYDREVVDRFVNRVTNTLIELEARVTELTEALRSPPPPPDKGNELVQIVKSLGPDLLTELGAHAAGETLLFAIEESRKRLASATELAVATLVQARAAITTEANTLRSILPQTERSLQLIEQLVTMINHLNELEAALRRSG